MTFELHMKGGSVVTFDATEVTTTRDALGGFSGIKWTTPKGKNVRKLHTVEVDQIAAVVRIKD